MGQSLGVASTQLQKSLLSLLTKAQSHIDVERLTDSQKSHLIEIMAFFEHWVSTPQIMLDDAHNVPKFETILFQVREQFKALDWDHLPLKDIEREHFDTLIATQLETILYNFVSI